MKKFLKLTALSLLLFSCETKIKEVEVNASAGTHYQGDDNGKKFSFGSDRDAEIAVGLVLAFAKKDSQLMMEIMADTAAYFPPTGSKPIVATKDEIPGIVELLHQPYDSINRKIWNAVPLVKDGEDFSKVTVTFLEKRYLKDGSEESVALVDRISIKDGKIFRIYQWMGER